MIASHVLWAGRVDGTARELLAEAERVEDPDDRTEREDAEEFLRGLLADGPMPSKAIRDEAREAGHSWATVRRAQKALEVEAYRDGGLGKAGAWYWRLAPKTLKNSYDAQQKTVSTLAKFEHLKAAADRGAL